MDGYGSNLAQNVERISVSTIDFIRNGKPWFNIGVIMHGPLPPEMHPIVVCVEAEEGESMIRRLGKVADLGVSGGYDIPVSVPVEEGDVAEIRKKTREVKLMEVNPV